MRKFSKYVAAFVIVALLVSTCSMSAFAATNETVAVLRYTEDGETKYENYTSLNTALVDAASGDTVYVVGDAILATNGTVKTGVTLVVPTSENYEDDTTTGYANVSGNGTTGEAYRTLTIESGATLTVNGTLLVAGNQQSTQPRTGFLTGDYGAINLEGNLIVNGTLYARGEISGTGTVTAYSGSTIYQRFQIADWRGGSASRTANELGVFPFSLYELGGISAKTVYMKGSELKGQSFIFAASRGFPGDINFLSNDEDALMRFTGTSESTEENIAIERNENGVSIATVNADVATGDLSFSFTVEVFGIQIPIDISTIGRDCPFGYNLNVIVADGANVTINSKLKMLPGSTFTLSDGATLNISTGMAMNFYGEGTYKAEYFYHPYGTEWDFDATAKLVNEGTGIVTNNGTVGSTDLNFSNVSGYKAVGEDDTTNVLEYNQATSQAVSVPFYVGTPDTTTPPTPAE